MVKARRAEDPRQFVLLEELESTQPLSSQSGTGRRRGSDKQERRILTDEENVFQAQSEWKTNGKFMLIDKESMEVELDASVRKSALNQVSESSRDYVSVQSKTNKQDRV